MADISPACSSSNHNMCPGYYKSAITCECNCHKRVAAAAPKPADLLAKLHADARIPPENLVGKLPRGNVQLDYLGHAAVTDILLAADPQWSWEPFAVDENGLPKIMYDAGGKPRALWIRLTVLGHTRIGIGTCSSSAGDPYKELIGDALRNAAMRFGVALSLWAKEEWDDLGLEAGDESSRVGDRSSGGSIRGSAPGENVPRPGNVRTLPTPSDADVARHPANGPTLPPDQAIAARAQALGVSDEERQKIIEVVTDGKSSSGKGLTPAQIRKVFAELEARAESRA